MIPVYGFLEGDTLGLLVLVEESDTVATVIEKIKVAAAVRVAPKEGGRLRVRGRDVHGNTTIRQLGLTPLERIDVVEVGR